MKNRHKISGFTMVELLIVVAIIAVLSGVGVVAVQSSQRDMALIEREAIAKEIFVAAQNHLTMAESQGYLGSDVYGKPGTDTEDTVSGKQLVYYFTVNGNTSFSEDPLSLLNMMLPFGSIDETIRLGGSYIIRYQPKPARILDVFYCSTNDSRYNHTFDKDEYANLLELRDNFNEDGTIIENNRNNRKNYGDAVVGWFGGESPMESGEYTVVEPEIEVVNAEKLTVTVTNRNPVEGDFVLKLIISSKENHTSDDGSESVPAKVAFLLDPIQHDERVTLSDGQYTIVLDDITETKRHFADMNNDIPIYSMGDSETDTVVPAIRQGTFIPGEDIIVQAVAYNNASLSNIAYSREITTNSLFADIEKTGEDIYTAKIGNIRHLENLDDHISGLNVSQTNIKSAAQVVDLSAPVSEGADSEPESPPEESDVTLGGEGTGGDSGDADSGSETNKDLSWAGFKKAVGQETSIKIFDVDNAENDDFRPVSPSYPLTYDGQNHSIEGIVVNYPGDAGLFGKMIADSGISNLQLIDFNIKGNDNAGVLAGKLTGTTVSNVVAYNSGDGMTATVEATGDAGGLIGSISGGTVSKSAAAVIVEGKNAGGLIGKSSGATITASYSGGHTDAGEYYNHDADGKRTTAIYSVTGTANAGGLIGDAGDSEISNSYSTCSAKSATAGGLVGTASGDIDKSYATGLVSGTTAGAFAGTYTGTATNCLYYEIINEIPGDEYTYLSALSTGSKDGITALDANANAYNVFVGAPDTWNPAVPYDDTLETYYQNNFNLETVEQLLEGSTSTVTVTDDDFVATHYGDWPAPEVFVINTVSGD